MNPAFIDAHNEKNPPKRDLFFIWTRPDSLSDGSSNGVLCLVVDHFTYKDEIILWNPAIRKLQILPSPELPCSGFSFSYDWPEWSKLVFGFGFDTKTNDFKVVRIAEYVKDWKGYGYQVPELLSHSKDIQIYSLNTGTWRNINKFARKIDCRIAKGSPQAYVNGVAYRNGVIKDDATSVMIISFDLGSEVFDCFRI